MASVQQATERTQRRIERANTNRMKDAGVGDVQLPTFTLDSLKGSTTAATVPSPTPTTGYAGLAGAIESSQDAFTKGLAERAASTQTRSEDSMDMLLQSLINSPGQTTLTDQAYRQGVDPAEAELKDINQKILEEDVGLRRRLERLDKNETGMLDTGLSIEKRRIENESISKQADLAVIQLSKQGKYDSAKAIADRAVAAKVEEQTQRNKILEFIYSENKDLFTTAEKRLFETQQGDRERKLKMEADKEMARFEQIIKQSDPLYQAQLRKARIDIDQALSSNQPIDVSSLVAKGVPAPQANSSTLTSLLQSKGIGQGTRTQLANVLGVVNATQDLANKRLDGKFEGINPLTGALNTKIGGFWGLPSVGLPFRDTVKSQGQIENEGYIEAINLKVQQWASGASLTDQQTKQVNRFTPSTGDTDAAVRTKLNNLTNFMLTQAQSQLQSEGVDFVPAKVNLFETMDLLDQATPEQLRVLQEEGLIQQN